MSEQDVSDEGDEPPKRYAVALDTLKEIFAAEWTKSLGGRDAMSYMSRVTFIAVNGTPNWGARTGELGLNILSAYNEAYGNVRLLYDLDQASHASLGSP